MQHLDRAKWCPESGPSHGDWHSKHAKLVRMCILRKKRSRPAGDDLRALMSNEVVPYNRSLPCGLHRKHVNTIIMIYFSKKANPHGTRRFKSDCVEQSGALKSVRAVRISFENKHGFRRHGSRATAASLELMCTGVEPQ